MTDHTPSDAAFDPTDPLVAAWASQSDDVAPPLLTSDPTTIADSAAKAHRKDQRRLLWLNVREVLGCAVAAGFFVSFAFDSARPFAVLATAAVILGVGCYLAINSLRHHRADRRWGTSVRDQVARRLAQVDHRASLYRSIGWWYLLPFAVAFALFRYSFEEPFTSEDLIALGVISVLLAGAYWLNRWIGRTKYEPEVRRLELLLADFDEGVATAPTDHDKNPRESS
jgi:hypothetical protein